MVLMLYFVGEFSRLVVWSFFFGLWKYRFCVFKLYKNCRREVLWYVVVVFWMWVWRSWFLLWKFWWNGDLVKWNYFGVRILL